MALLQNISYFCKLNMNFLINSIIPPVVLTKREKFSSKSFDLQDYYDVSNRKFKDDNLKRFRVPLSSFYHESLLAGNPQSLECCDFKRNDVLKKWERRPLKKRQNHTIMLCAAIMFTGITKG